jgi:tetratricopeptide (TPR) repeat protein
MARDARRWGEAERLDVARIEWNRQRAATVLAKQPQDRDAPENNVLRALAGALHDLSQIRREQGSATCVQSSQEALILAEAIGDPQLAGICAFTLGQAYESLEGIRDLALAEVWYRRSLELCAKEDRMGRAACLAQLGSVAFERFRKSRGSPMESLSHLSSAERDYLLALETFPAEATRERATVHSQLGNVYMAAGRIDVALGQYTESVRYSEAIDGRFGAGLTRHNAAVTLAGVGRFADAHDWAQAALRDFEATENAERYVVEALKLLEQIESARQATSPPS